MIIEKFALNIFTGEGETKQEACEKAAESADWMENCETQYFQSYEEALEASERNFIGGAVKTLTGWEAFAAEIVKEQWETDEDGDLKDVIEQKHLKWIEAK